MADYNRVKIGSVYLTDDGLVTGLPCRVEVQGLHALKASKTGATAVAADGTPHLFTTPNLGKGAAISIKPYLVMKTVFDAAITAISTALSADANINITITGDTGTFDVDCKPVLPLPTEFPGTFTNERIDGVEFKFLVAEVN